MNKNTLNNCLMSCFNKDAEVSLYIHIPFCKGKCAYCGFYSVSECSVFDYEKELYFKNLLAEVKKAQSYFKNSFESIYIGGGTPLLESNLKYLDELFNVLDTSYAKEVTIEANAFNIADQSIPIVKKYASRLSVGIQSFNKETLKKIGRFYTSFDEVKTILTDFVNLEVNFDFILTPFEKNIIETTFKPLFDFCTYNNLKFPEHISLYILTLEDGTPLKKRFKYTADDEDKMSEELKIAWGFLEQCGYVHYEVSAFALDSQKSNNCILPLKSKKFPRIIPSFASYHNLRYWHLSDYIGLGSSASSHSTKGFDVTNSASYKDYGKSSPFNTYVIELLSKEDIAIESILTHLRTIEGITDDEFYRISGFSLSRTVEKASRYCEKNHNIKDYYKNGRLSLNANELLFSDFYINLLVVNLTP